jgi:hypothetical protein
MHYRSQHLLAVAETFESNYKGKIMFLPHDLYLNLGGFQQHFDAVVIDLVTPIII